jgi:hypothetical protein
MSMAIKFVANTTEDMRNKVQRLQLKIKNWS